MRACPTPPTPPQLIEFFPIFGGVTHLTVAISAESFFCLRKLVAQWGRVCHTLDMPNQGAADKKHLTIRMPVILWRRVKKLADSRGETVTDVVLSIIHKSVDNVELTPAEIRQIADEVEAARRKE